MKQFTSINELDLGGGIDAQSPETNIPETFSSDISNMDPKARGSIAKRKGVECLGGSLPLRVSAVTQPEANRICFTLDESIDVSQVRNRPINVQGISYNGATYDRDTNGEVWWPTTDTAIERTLVASTPLVIEAADHGYNTSDLIVQVKEVGVTSNSHVFVDSISVNDSTLDITINHNLESDTSVYVVITPSPSSTGTSYVTTTTADTTLITIPAATHQLSHVQIVPVIYLKTSPSDEFVEIYEETMTIAPNGDVTINFEEAPGIVGDFIKVILRAATITNIATGTVPAVSTSTITIENPTTPFQVVSVWLDDGGSLERVIPQDVTYNEATDTTDVTFLNPGTSESFEIYWEDGILETQEICVEGILASTVEWTDAPVVVWGLIDYHTLPTSFSDQGKALSVHHLSTYSAQGLRFPVTAIQGSPMRLDTTIIQELFPRLASRISADQTVAPYFSDLGEGGRVESSNGAFGRLDVDSITWTSGTSVDVVVTVPDMVATDSSLDEDYLTLTDCGYSSNEGTFPITAVVEGINQLTFTITNTNRIDDLDDETDTGAYAAIYTDTFEVTDETIFLPGDTVTGSGLEDQDWNVQGQVGTKIYINNVRQRVAVPGGLRVRAVRTDAVMLPLRDNERTPAVSPLVHGDSVVLSGHARRVRVGSVNPDSNEAITLTTDVDGQTVTLTTQLLIPLG